MCDQAETATSCKNIARYWISRSPNPTSLTTADSLSSIFFRPGRSAENVFGRSDLLCRDFLDPTGSRSYDLRPNTCDLIVERIS